MPIKYVIKDWKEASATAVAEVTTMVASSTASGFPDVAKAGSAITYIIVNDFHFAESADAISDTSYEKLEADVRKLETDIDVLPGP